MVPADLITVQLVYCPASAVVDSCSLRLPPGSTLAQAVLASGLLQRHGLQLQQLQAGIWGRMQPPDTLLRAGDRVEIYRPLQVDPKEARRLRYGRHKAAAQARRARPTGGSTPPTPELQHTRPSPHSEQALEPAP